MTTPSIYPRLTLAEPGQIAYAVRQLSRGGGDGSLSRQVIGQAPWRQPERPGRARLIVAYARPEVSVYTFFRFGWPVEWLGRSGSIDYKDVFTRSASPRRARGGMLRSNWYWHSSGVSFSSITGAGTWAYWNVAYDGFALAVAIVIGSCYLGRALRWFLMRGVRRHEGPLASVRTHMGLLCGLLAMLGVAVGTAATMGTRESTGISSLPRQTTDMVWDAQGQVTAYKGDPYIAFTSLDSAAVQSMTPGPEADAAIARAIDEAMPWGATDDLYLAFSFEEETMAASEATSIGWPWSWLRISKTMRSWLHRDGSSTSADYGPGPWRVRWQRGSLVYLWGSDTRIPTRGSVTLSLPRVALNAVCLWLIWKAGSGVLWLWGRRTRARRRRRGQCLNCGYSLAGLG